MADLPQKTVEPVRLEKIPESPRLKRVRALAWLLDRSIPLPNGWRIGLDPIIGIIPGLGDIIGSLVSVYLIYEAACLGLPKHVLVKMGGNVLMETLVGEFPVIGDFFDFVWQANTRNVTLIEKHYRAGQPERPPGKVWATFGLLLVLFLLFLIAVTLTMCWFIWKLLLLGWDMVMK